MPPQMLLRRLACNVGSALCAPSTSGRTPLLNNASPFLAQSSSSSSSCPSLQQCMQFTSLSSLPSIASSFACHRRHHSGLPSSISNCQSSTSWQHAFPHTQVRGIFGAHREPVNPQVHTHDKYKIKTSQPTYE